MAKFSVKLSSFTVLLYVLATVVQAPEVPKLSRNVTLPGRDSLVMANSLHLFTVLYSSTSYGIEVLQVSINSTDGSNLNTCNLTIRLDPDKNMVARDILQLLKGTVLRNGRHIVTWIYNQNKGFYELRPLIIDVNKCSYKSLTLPTRPDKVFTARLPWIIPYENTFDLFYLSDEPPTQKCWPCRFNEQGEQIELGSGVKNASFSPLLLLEPLDYSKREGYFFVQNYVEFTPGVHEKALLQILDDNFAVSKETVIDHSTNSISTNFNDVHQKIGLCTAFPEFYHAISCEQYDSDFNLIFYNHMPLLQNQSADEISLKLDLHGNSHVIFTLQETLDVPRKYRYILLDASGKLVKTLDFGELEIKLFSVGLQSLIIGDQYCFYSLEMDLNSFGPQKIIRCIDIVKNVK